MLGDTAQLLVDKYDGDLRQLRDAAERDPKREHQLLMEFKGIGQVGGNIFLREVQTLWDEVFPVADDSLLETAQTKSDTPVLCHQATPTIASPSGHYPWLSWPPFASPWMDG